MEEKELLLALQSFRQEVLFVKAVATGHHGKYAQLKDVVLETKDALKRHGLIVVQSLVNTDGLTSMHTELIHIESGASVESEYPLAYKGDDSQKQGSAITYARRYGYVTILGLLVDADDDGALASEVGKPDKKLEAAEFYAEKAKMIKTLRGKDMALDKVGELVQKTLGKPRVETIDEVEKVLKAAGVKSAA